MEVDSTAHVDIDVDANVKVDADRDEDASTVYSTSEHIHMAFLNKHVHPIDDIIENRSWMNLTNHSRSTNRTAEDDDDLRKEEESIRQSQQRMWEELQGVTVDVKTTRPTPTPTPKTAGTSPSSRTPSTTYTLDNKNDGSSRRTISGNVETTTTTAAAATASSHHRRPRPRLPRRSLHDRRIHRPEVTKSPTIPKPSAPPPPKQRQQQNQQQQHPHDEQQEMVPSPRSYYYSRLRQQQQKKQKRKIIYNHNHNSNNKGNSNHDTTSMNSSKHNNNNIRHRRRMDEIDIEMIEQDALSHSVTSGDGSSSYPSDEARLFVVVNDDSGRAVSDYNHNDNDDEDETRSEPFDEKMEFRMTTQEVVEEEQQRVTAVAVSPPLQTRKVLPHLPQLLPTDNRNNSLHRVRRMSEGGIVVKHQHLHDDEESSIDRFVITPEDQIRYATDDNRQKRLVPQVQSAVAESTISQGTSSSHGSSSVWKMGQSFRDATSIDIEAGGGGLQSIDIFQQDGFWKDGFWKSDLTVEDVDDDHDCSATHIGRPEARQDYVSSISRYENYHNNHRGGGGGGGGGISNDYVNQQRQLQEREEIDRASPRDDAGLQSIPERQRISGKFKQSSNMDPVENPHYPIEVLSDGNVQQDGNHSHGEFVPTTTTTPLGHGDGGYEKTSQNHLPKDDTAHTRTDRTRTVATDISIDHDDNKSGIGRGGCRKYCSVRLIIIVLIHLFLIAGGGVALYVFLRQSSQPPTEESISVNPSIDVPPTNDSCNARIGQTLLEIDDSSNTMEGTLLGATSDTNPCGSVGGEDQLGVWYATIGTGSSLVVTVSNTNDDDVELSVSAMTGSCSNLQCLESQNNIFSNSTFDTITARTATGMNSTTWISEVGTIYYLFVYSMSGESTAFQVSLRDSL